MARRFGRNQKRKLRAEAQAGRDAQDTAAKIVVAATASMNQALNRAAKVDSDLRGIVRSLEMLLGQNSVVFPPVVHEDAYYHPHDTIEHAVRVGHSSLRPFGEPSVMHRAYVLLRRVEATLEVCGPHNDPRTAVHWTARARIGRDQIGETRVETYWASDRALAQQTPESIAKIFAESAVRFFRQHHEVDLETGRIVRKEAPRG